MAVVFPCDAKVKCGPSAQALMFASFGVIDGNPGLDFDSPITNQSTNHTDHPIFTAVGCAGLCVSLVSQDDANQCAEAQMALCGPFDGPNPAIYTTQGCLGLCVSLVSQADADTCAAQMQVICDDSPGALYAAQDCYGGTHLSLVSQADADASAAAVVCPPIPPPPPPLDGGGNGGPVGPKKPIPGFNLPVFYNFQQVCCKVCPDGSQFCFAVGLGKVSAKTQQLADEIAFLMACSLADKNIACLGTMSPSSVCAGSALDATIQVAGTHYPYSISVESGALPAGMAAAFSGKGIIKVVGIADQPGAFNFTLRITDKQGNHMSKSYTLNVVGMSNDPILTKATQGTAYSEQLNAAGGSGPYTFALVAGALPAGLSLNAAGLISGTPTAVGTETFTVELTDASTSLACVKEFTLQVEVSCGVGTNWLNPGTCRVRIKNYVAGVTLPIGLCAGTWPGGSVEWDGTFSEFQTSTSINPGDTPDFYNNFAFDRINGKQMANTFAPNGGALLFWDPFTTNWFVFITTYINPGPPNSGGVWTGFRADPTMSNPSGIYPASFDCTGAVPSLELEVYSL